MTEERITGLHNPKVQALCGLVTRPGRQAAGSCLVEGVNLVREALKRSDGVRALWLSDAASEEAILLCAYARCRVYRVPENIMRKISGQVTPQGILAEVKLPETPAPEALGDRIIVLEDVQDPGNVGTILRTANAAGFTGAVLSEGSADPFSPKCLRASAGCALTLPTVIAVHLPETLRDLRARGYALMASVLSGADFFRRTDTAERFVLMIGNEGNGLSEALLRLATHHLSLPMPGETESLNAAVAAGIMIYDLAFRPDGQHA
jgi:TrmH family RNA methyltransferase